MFRSRPRRSPFRHLTKSPCRCNAPADSPVSFADRDQIFSPAGRISRGIDADDSVRSNSEFAQLFSDPARLPVRSAYNRTTVHGATRYPRPAAAPKILDLTCTVSILIAAARSLVSLVPPKKTCAYELQFFPNPALIQPNQLEQ